MDLKIEIGRVQVLLVTVIAIYALLWGPIWPWVCGLRTKIIQPFEESKCFASSSKDCQIYSKHLFTFPASSFFFCENDVFFKKKLVTFTTLWLLKQHFSCNFFCLLIALCLPLRSSNLPFDPIDYWEKTSSPINIFSSLTVLLHLQPK